MRTFFMRGGKAFVKAVENSKALTLIKSISGRKVDDGDEFEELDEDKTRENVKKVLREMREETAGFRLMSDEEILTYIDYCCEARGRLMAAMVKLSNKGAKDER